MAIDLRQAPGAARCIAVSGASGFIGRHLCRELARQGIAVRALVRSDAGALDHGVAPIALGALEHADEDLLVQALSGADAIVHLAGRAHVMRERQRDSDAAYHAANVIATERLLAACARARVPRVVFASTVKVNGEASAARPFLPDDPVAPEDAYARSKAEAERRVLGAQDTHAVVLRLPLVYGAGVRGNFERLIEAVASERALPIGAIHNRRSMAYVGNVCDAVGAVLATSPSGPGRVHFVADEASVSTPALARAIGDALGIPARLLNIPVPVLVALGVVSGRSRDVERLVGSLEVDTSSLRDATGWRPRCTLAQGLAETTTWWRMHHAI